MISISTQSPENHSPYDRRRRSLSGKFWMDNTVNKRGIVRESWKTKGKSGDEECTREKEREREQ